MEETLKPMALEKFATITEIFRTFSKAQESRMAAMANGETLSQKAEDDYQELREQLTAEVESVQFHQQKIEYLVDQLYAYNRRLTALGGQMLRLARSEEHTSELQSLMRISYAVFCLKKKQNNTI